METLSEVKEDWKRRRHGNWGGMRSFRSIQVASV